jgi:biotin transport system substrate-specific component
MTQDQALYATARSFKPLGLRKFSPTRQTLAVILGTLFLAACSYMTIPMVPVPMTMQTFGVGVIGAIYGWKLGGITIIVWLLEAAVGLPVLSSGGGGIARFAGPTAGYLFAFPFVGAFVGYLTERGWDGKRPVLALVSMLALNGICLIVGGLWLSTSVGLERAMDLGVMPFLLGGVLKSVLGALALLVLERWPLFARGGSS